AHSTLPPPRRATEAGTARHGPAPAAVPPRITQAGGPPPPGSGASPTPGRLGPLPPPPAPAEPVDSSPERVASSALARLRIFAPGTIMRWSANCSPGRGLNGSGLGLRNAGHAASGSRREDSPFLSATLTT